MAANSNHTLIVGAGIAGLYAAYLLKAQGHSVTLLEARAFHGGRVASVSNWTDFPLELGAAYIHGNKQLFYELSTFNQLEVNAVDYAPYFFYKGKLLSLAEAKKKKKLKKAGSFFDRQYKYKGHELSVYDFLKEKKYFAKTKEILTGLAYEYGTDLENLGMRSLAIEEYNWHSGDNDFVSKTPFIEILNEFYEPVKEDIRLNTIVKSIDYQNAIIKVTDQQNKVYEAKQVIITVPLSVLKSRMIHFSPALPAAKTNAIQRLGFDVGMKVFLKFNAPFWPTGMTELYGGKDCPRYEDAAMGHSSQQAILCAYLMGKQALKFSSLPKEEVVTTLLNELDTLFGDQQASTAYQDYLIQDWGKEPYIWGAYSFASPFSEGEREDLAKPINQQLYFAGEATNFFGHNSTLHGAMETAELVVETILEGNNSTTKNQQNKNES